jgi:uncharacterized protein (DUF1501 family)
MSHRHGSCLEHGPAHVQDHRRWSRRDFMVRLGLASVGTSFLLGSRPVSVFGQAPLLRALRQVAGERILVLVQLNGGNDGLNTIIPVNNDIYYRNRPTISIRKTDAILLSDETGLHPAMGSLRPLWDQGYMAAVHNTGYPESTRSHFEGTVNWSTARDQGMVEDTGWLGRYMEDVYFENVFTPLEYPLAVRIGGPATLFQSRFGNLSVTFSDAQQFERFLEQGGFYDTDNPSGTVYGRELGFVSQVANASFRYVAAVQDAAGGGQNLVTYPNDDFADALAVVARMLRGGLATPVYTVSKGGFDTHSDQGGTQGGHASLLADVADGIAAFFDDLAQDGLDDRVLVMTFSEFGRTLVENGSRGTDHGAGAPMLLFGPGLRGGLFGQPSNLTTLYGGDPLFTTDYRQVYASLLQDWFGLPAPDVDGVLGRTFSRLDLVAAKATASEASSLPAAFRLAQNYPNPFNPETTIAFTLARPGPVSLRVFDLRGRLVETLVDGVRPAGEHTVRLRAAGWPSGPYLYRLETPAGTQSRKMILLK